MAEQLCMKDMIQGIEDVFDPPLTYDGNYGFPVTSLYACSKMDGKRNLVQEYFEKNYLNKIYDLLKDYVSIIGDIFLVSDLAVNNKGRELKISLEILTQRICMGLVGGTPELGVDYTTYKSQLLAFFRNYKKAISLLENGEKDASLEKECQTIQDLYLYNEERRKEKYGKSYRPLPYSIYLEKIRNSIVGFLVNYNRLVEICNQPVDLQTLESTLDLDKFYFLITKHLLDSSLFSERQNGLLPNAFSFVELYIANLLYLKKEFQYELSLRMQTLENGEMLVHTDDLICQYNEIKNRHPEFASYQIEAEEGVDYRDFRVAQEEHRKLENFIRSKELVASWNFVRKGERGTVSSSSGSGTHFPKVVKTEDEKNSELRRRIDFFEGSAYAYRMEGIHQFEGYVGYVYANGFVIFERFYKDTVSYELADEHATYVMNFDNFVEMSKKTKTEIIAYIKSGNTDVRRVYHTSTWEERINQIIQGSGYDLETLSFIDRLVENGEIKRKGVTNG